MHAPIRGEEIYMEGIRINVSSLRDLYLQLDAIIDKKECDFLDYPLLLEKGGNHLVDLEIVLYNEDGYMLAVFKEIK